MADKTVQEISGEVRCRAETVWNVVRRFNLGGLASLEDVPRSGRPAVYDETVRGQLVLTAKTHPQQVGQPYSHWTLDRLVEYAHQQLHSIANRVVQAEGRFVHKEKLDSPIERPFFSSSSNSAVCCFALWFCLRVKSALGR